MDKNLAEFVGILLGDGSLSVYGKEKEYYRVKISFNSRDDNDYIFYVKKLICKIFDEEAILKYRKNENTAELYLFKRKIIRFLIGIGLVLSPKWNRARIPKLLFNSPFDIFVLRGYFDTDGCIAIVNNNGKEYPRLEMKISPSPMQKQFIEILKKYNFRFGAYQIGRGKVRIQINGIRQLKKWSNLVGFSNRKHMDKSLLF